MLARAWLSVPLQRAARKVAVMRRDDTGTDVLMHLPDTDEGQVVDEREINPQGDWGKKPLQGVVLFSA